MKKYISALALIAFASGAQAVTYFEYTDGDAGKNSKSAVELGLLPMGGSADIVGTVNGTGDSVDTYAFTLEEASHIAVTSLSLAAGNRQVQFQLRPVGGSQQRKSLGNTTYDVFGVVDAGEYLLSVRENSSGANSYVINIAAIPVPASLPMMAFALGGFAWMRRRKQRTV